MAHRSVAVRLGAWRSPALFGVAPLFASVLLVGVGCVQAESQRASLEVTALRVEASAPSEEAVVVAAEDEGGLSAPARSRGGALGARADVPEGDARD